jgi:ABC-2 type transport system ATP-binding protein
MKATTEFIKENAIKVQGLSKCFDDITAVNHVSFYVKKGEVYGFLGPNGAGKTTTIRILTGILKPDSGVVSVMDFDVLKESLRVKQLISVVPEVSNVYVELSAWQNLMLIGELYGISKLNRKTRAKTLLKQFGIYTRRHSLTRGFSKGMKKRLMLCMALLTNPRILFLDEPTAGLDVQSTRLMRDTIQKYNDEGGTVFLSTHNMEEANQLCDRIAIINHGRIATIDTPENLRMKGTGLKAVEISFNRSISAKTLCEYTFAKSAKKFGDKIKLFTDKPGKVIEKIIEFARLEGLIVISLNTLVPSLEDVFVELTKQERVDYVG